MYARPDKEEMEEGINNFLSRLEKQEQRGFRDLKTLLSELPCPQPAAGRSLSVSEAIEAGFLPARGTGPRKSSHLSLRFSDLFLIQRNLRDKRRFCKSAPPAVREAACQSLRTCSPSQTGALQTTTLGILPLFVQANSRVLSNAGDSDGQNSNFMQAGDSDGRGDGQKPCFQSASNCAASKSLSC